MEAPKLKPFFKPKMSLLNCHPELRPAGHREDGADEAELEDGGRDVEHDGGEHGGDAAAAAVNCLKKKKYISIFASLIITT